MDRPGLGKAALEAAQKELSRTKTPAIERSYVTQKPQQRKAKACEGADPGWIYYEDFGFLRVGTFDVTDDAYVATLLEFRLGCRASGGGVVVQASGNGTIDPHPK